MQCPPHLSPFVRYADGQHKPSQAVSKQFGGFVPSKKLMASKAEEQGQEKAKEQVKEDVEEDEAVTVVMELDIADIIDVNDDEEDGDEEEESEEE